MTRSPMVLVAAAAILAALTAAPHSSAAADEFKDVLLPVLEKHCVQCHGREKTKGRVDLHALTSPAQFLSNPKLLATLVEVIDSAEMPPEDKPPLTDTQRSSVLAALKHLLASSTANLPIPEDRIRRLNRFQYNNAVKDLFLINRDLFALPEKLMTRHGDHLAKNSGTMPDTVSVSCQSFGDGAGFRGIDAFPKDLRAAHGFDNQSNQLTLSPILLDAYLKLSVSILESPDFHPETVGVWKSFFAEPPAGSDHRAEIAQRLRPFLHRAFRGAESDATVTRYTGFAMAQIAQGASFTEAMKKVSSAVLSSPLFLFQCHDRSADHAQFALASKLSFFLWGSAPDDELLALAASGQLLHAEVLQRTITRMMADRKIERFLDSFPSQWMQLENILGAAPDPQKHRLYSLDPGRPAGSQMVLEPLLLFDAVFVENRGVKDFIAPAFSYRSEFLKEWYASDFQLKFDPRKVTDDNRASDEARSLVSRELASIHAQRTALLAQINARTADIPPTTAQEQNIGLKPYAAWDFKGNLRDSVHGLDLEAHGNVEFQDGMVVLNGSYLESKNLPITLRAKTMEAWIRLPNPKGASGSVMTIRGPDKRFDSIALGQRAPNRWVAGSEELARTKDFGGAPEETADPLLHLVVVYNENGSTTFYRNGVPYGAPYNRGLIAHPKNKSTVLFGRSDPADTAAQFPALHLQKARLYDRALTAQEVASAYSGEDTAAAAAPLAARMSAEELAKQAELQQALARIQESLRSIPPFKDPGTAREQAQKDYDAQVLALQRSRTFTRTPTSDPRYGGIITNAAVLTMTSGPKRTLPIARGSWIIEVIFNDPPPPPPNNVPPLNESDDDKHLTIREQFAKHRENPDCASCHSRIDPLGFALENFDGTGRWRGRYENGRDVDPGGTLLKRSPFKDVVQFKSILLGEEKRFAKAFTAHLLRFALARELTPADSPSIDAIVQNTAAGGFRLRDILREVILSESFLKAAAVSADAR